MISKNNRLYQEDLDSLLDDLERGIFYSIVDVFNDYFDYDNIPSYTDEVNGLDEEDICNG